MDVNIILGYGFIFWALGIFMFSLIIMFVNNKVFDRAIRRSEDYTYITNLTFLKRIVSFGIFIIGIGVAISYIPSLKNLAQSLLAGAGILAVAIGFASQQALANIVAGIFIVIFKPYRVGDRITIKDTLSGTIEDITLRHTVIRNFENRRIVIPNSIISNEILVNSDLIDKTVCKWFEIDISFDSDLSKAKDIIREETLKHPLFMDNRSEAEKAENIHPVTVRVISLEEFSLKIRAWAWAKDNADAFVLGCDLLESVKARFEAEGIEIPYPYRTIVMKKN